MKILIRTLSILAMTIAFSKPASAMENFNVNNMSDILSNYQVPSPFSDSLTECGTNIDEMDWMPDYIKKLINLCDKLIKALKYQKYRITFTELFPKVHHAICYNKNKEVFSGPLNMVQAELLDTLNNKYTDQLDKELSSYIPDYLKPKNNKLLFSTMKHVCLYKKIHEDLIKNKKMDYEKLIKDKAYYDILNLIEKIKNEKIKIMNKAQSMYFDNLLDESNKEFTEFKEKTKETIKKFIKEVVKLELLTSINWIESYYNSIFYTYIKRSIDQFTKQSIDDLLYEYRIILDKTNSLISNRKTNIYLNKYLVKIKNACVNLKNKIKNINTSHIKAPIEQGSMKLRIKEQNNFIEFMKKELVQLNNFSSKIIITMYDKNLFDDLFDFIDKCYTKF